ncbi:hypothetical protein [Faecalispora jeddahensis]|uniref:hypothetical protein n=1 Tax=Faecalispora jeddahensis TaxID=1414721 RepID=UPI0028AB1E3A|nr:hypothetical protein [Faecalispora jeddahensis]
MKQFMKKMISTICVCAMLVAPTTNMAFAASANIQEELSPITMNQKTVSSYLNISDEEKANIIRAYGFTEQEIQYYVWQESNKNPNRITFGPNSSSGGISIMGFPSNPKIGDTYRQSFKITNTELTAMGIIPEGASVQEIAKAIMKKKPIPILAALGVAASIAQIYGDSKGYKGYNITINYLYTYDNDGFANWVYSKLEVKGYK